MTDAVILWNARLIDGRGVGGTGPAPSDIRP